jgi:polyhydroxyalkanoate synthase subunit PhaC
MSQSAPQPNPQEYLQNLMQAGQDVVQQFERALAGGNVIAASDLKWPAATPTSVTEMFDLQRRYFEQMGQLWSSFLPGLSGDERKPVVAPPKGDNRFRDEAWQKEPYYDAVKQSYLIGAKFLHDFVEQANVDEKMKMQLRFYARQFTDAISPSNFPMTNPEVIRTAIDTRCESLTEGMKNLMEDIQKGRISMTDESAFEVGENIAITPGEVIYENELIQLIQYKPTTEQVEKRPLLLVPPCINKYYVLDLTPANSFVRYALEQGHPVFLISWRSADESIAHLTWDDYIEKGIVQAVEVVTDVAKAKDVNILGFCVGGTLLGCAAAVMAARGDDRLASVTLLTTMLDFADTGEIGIMVDENYVRTREATIGQGGILPGKELAFVFSTLRANDLIWSFVVNNYLKGATPDAFDLLYWNSDSVNLPGPMYCWYIRHAYLENAIKDPGRTVQCGVPVDLSAIKAPVYLLAAKEDHIVPWKTAYLASRLLGGDIRFVLGASGHIAGVVNPAARNKRNYWLNTDLGAEPDAWLDQAQEVPGSWWPDWDRWLKERSTGTKAAPAKLGNKTYAPIEPAPGRYVKVRAV